MYLDRICRFQTGVSLVVSSAPLCGLIEAAMAGRRTAELEQIKRLDDLYAHLAVIVYEGAAGLIKRRSAWAGKIRTGLLAHKPVPYQSFVKLFWRKLDDEDPDGDEWYRLIARKAFDAELIGLLDKVRSAQRALHQRTTMLAGREWGSAGRGDLLAF